MKSFKFILSFVLFSGYAVGQSDLDLGTYNVPKNFRQAHETYISDDAIILNYSPYLPVTSLNLVKFGLYQSASIKSGADFSEKRIPADEGIIQECYYSGDTITEFLIHYRKGFPKYKCTYALRWRSCKTMETFGEEKILAEHEFTNPASYQSMRVIKVGTGYAFIEITDVAGAVTFLSEQFEEVNKIKLNSSIFSSIECKECYFALPNKEGSILIGFSDMTLGPLNKVRNKILRLTEKGETTWYETTLNDAETSLASHGNYHYDAEKEELSWAFFTRSKEKYGYGIVKWNSKNGLSENVKILDFENIFKNEPEITNYYKANKLSMTDLWSRLESLASIRLLKNGGEEYIIIQKPHITYELISATYVIKVNEEGDFEWIKPILSEIRDPSNFTSAEPFIKNGKLHLFVADYSTNSKKNEHVNLSFRKEGGTISFFDLTLDPKDGSETMNEKYNFTTEAGVQIMSMQLNEEKQNVVIELQKGKQLSYKKLEL